MDKELIKNQLKEIVLNESRPIPKGILMEKIKSKNNVSKNLIYDLIDELIYSKDFKQIEPTKYIVEGYINAKLLNEKIVGNISLNNLLDGYVKIDDGTKFFIHNKNLNFALDGDLVEITLMDKFSLDGTQHGVVNKIIERSHKFGVGTFRITGNSKYVELDDKKNYLNIVLDDTSNLVNGHKILISFKTYDKNNIYGAVSKIIGHINDVGNDILSIVYENGIEPNFSQEVIDFVNSYKCDEEMDKIRKDLSNLNFITIDPSTSKDLDDAFYLEYVDNKYILYVSIADVSAYVPYDSLLDKKTINRATSIYLVDRVIPMLPHKLSNDNCSLNENEPKRTLTCKMVINENGDFEQIDVFPSYIKSRYKLSYDEVNSYFKTNQARFDSECKTMIDNSLKLHNILRNKKNKLGYIDLEIKEPKIIINEKGFPIDIQIKERGTAQMMIEDFMVAANNAVTIKANELQMPFIYRIHEQPSLEKLHSFKIETTKKGFIIPSDFFTKPTPLIAKQILDINKDKNQEQLSKLLLKCMSKAIYSTQNIGHFGLAINDYTHFTSPIRRYPDLIVHRLFWMYYFAPHLYTDEQRTSFSNSLNQLCENSTDKEINAISIEREVNSLKFCQYMSKQINKTFNATISAIKSFGIFVELDNTIEGLVRLKNIGGDFWNYDNEKYCIRGKKTNKEFNFGDKLTVRLLSVDIDLRQINFEIVGFERK